MKIFGIPIWIAMLGIVIGIALASIGRIAPNSPPNEGDVERDLVSTDASKQEVQDRAGMMGSMPTKSTPIDREQQIRATEGLVFEPAVINGQFVGYRVIANRDDPRVQIGDIITSVGGAPVEDSAAGSELFIAALADGSAEIQRYRPDRQGN